MVVGHVVVHGGNWHGPISDLFRRYFFNGYIGNMSFHRLLKCLHIQYV